MQMSTSVSCMFVLSNTRSIVVFCLLNWFKINYREQRCEGEEVQRNATIYQNVRHIEGS